MTIKSSDRLILIKTESTYGTDSTPDATLNAIQVTNIELTAMNAETADRGLLKPYFGNSEQMVYGENVTLSFDVELQSSGAAGTAPAFGPLLKACGMSETVSPANSVEYLPITDDMESVTCYCFVGTNLHEFNGGRGTFTISMQAGIPYLNFTFTGMYVQPVTGVKGTPDYSAFVKPLVTGEGRTQSFEINGYSANIYEFNIDIGNEVVFNESLLVKKVDITSRASTGSITIDAPLISEHDFFTEAQQSTTGLMKMVHGATPGQIVEISAPKTQPQNPSYGDQNGVTTLSMDLTLIPSTGNDELSITFK